MISRNLLPLLLLGISFLPASGQDRPNIVLIMADDMGYSDLGSYGGEIDTPNLNRLAAGGLRFSDFYTTGRCCPTRAALMTGLYPHQAGMGWMTATSLGRPAYQGELNESSVTVAEVLQTAGYGTYMAGKWHLTRRDHENPEGDKRSWPLQRGFDQFFGTLRGGSYFSPDTLTQGNNRVAPPAEGFYYTDAISAAAVGFIQTHLTKTPKTPFFCYVPYTAPHWPLHVPTTDLEKYRKRYAKGWDILRQERYERMHQMRLLEPGWRLPSRPASVPAWDSLSEAQQKDLVERMAIYAAQTERMDHGIGQLIRTLEAKRQLENTLILFIADNGASAEGGPTGFERLSGGTLGTNNSFASYGEGWANLSNTPFREFKHYTHEGGIASPCIAHWPRKIIERGRVRTDPTHLIDIMPTCVEIGRATYPKTRSQLPVPPMEGRSLVNLFKGMSDRPKTLYWEHEGHRAVRHGHWKLVAKFGQPWELYHLDRDRTETTDLTTQYPAVVKELSDLWQSYAERTDVLPLDGRPWSARVPAELVAAGNPMDLPVLPILPDPNAPTLPGEPSPASAALLPQRPLNPNVIVILADDLGYGDLGCYGSEKHRTPNIDRMATEGARLTSFYSTSGFCTPSRASLLTGCYPRRVSMHMNHIPPGTSTMRQVLFPVARKGLHPNEVTLAEALSELDYATACVGKWHLGDQKVFLPTRQGFDHYFGIPYSNDMGSKQFPVNPPLPLLRDEAVIEAPVDQTTLTKRYTEEAIQFIKANEKSPFFLYLPHTMPHNPIHVSAEFKDHSEHGVYASSIEELDWSTGQILNTLDELEIADNTLIIFTSDNGAAFNWGGSNAPLAGHKGSVMEGGMRVPFVARWNGQIPAGHESATLTSTLDLFPTVLALLGGELPKDRPIDGHDVWPTLSGMEEEADNESPEVFYYYQQDQLQAIRSGDWKLHLPLSIVRQRLGTPLKKSVPARLYNLSQDLAESKDLAADHPEVIAQLTALAEEAREELGDFNRTGKAARPAGLVDRPAALIKPAS